MADRNSLPPQVLEALRRGNKIEAIKLLRQAMAVGLAEAKSVVEAHDMVGGNSAPKAKAKAEAKSAAAKSKAANHTSAYIRAREDDLSPGEVPRSSASPLGIVVAIAAVAAAAWLFVKFG
jgi:hypothetical protein